MFACRQPPPQQPQISYTILTQADWCAVRTVARCELGLLLVVNTMEAGARDLVKLVVPEMRSDELGSKFFSIIRTGVQMSWKRRRSQTADIFCGLNQRDHGKPRCDTPWVLEEDNEEIAVDAMPFQLRFSVAGAHLHPSPVSAPATPFWEFPVQSRLALPETHCTAQTHHFANPGRFHLFEVLQQPAKQFRGALLGAPVPAGSNLRRPNGHGGRSCALSRHAFASLGPGQPFVSKL